MILEAKDEIMCKFSYNYETRILITKSTKIAIKMHWKASYHHPARAKGKKKKEKKNCPSCSVSV